MHAEEFKQRTTPVTVTLCQVIVNGNYMNALSGKCVKVGRKECGEGLTFTGLHFSDLVFIENHTAHNLNIKRSETENAK